MGIFIDAAAPDNISDDPLFLVAAAMVFVFAIASVLMFVIITNKNGKGKNDKKDENNED